MKERFRSMQSGDDGSDVVAGLAKYFVRSELVGLKPQAQLRLKTTS